MKKMLNSAAALALSGCLMLGSVAAAPAVFKDVPREAWYYTAVTRAASEGLAEGMGDGTFGVGKTMSNAHFVTWVSKMFYKDEIDKYAKDHPSKYWWRAFMDVAYTNGLLNGTTVGKHRQANATWSESLVNQGINRYDMAQIMANVVESQRWQKPKDLDILAAQVKIKDFSTVPSAYQDAVSLSYSMKLLSGYDDGTFKGDRALTRQEGAAIMCNLLDAKKNGVTQEYNNTTKLVNGEEPTEENVEAAIYKLQREFPERNVWDTTRPYFSRALGRGYGGDSFIFMLSDRIFGTFLADTVAPEEMKAGDVAYWSVLGRHILIQEVDRGSFTYAYCSNQGKISWDNTASVDDFNKNMDTIYTRYKDEGHKHSGGDGLLSDGEKPTERNVSYLLDSFQRRKYDQGDRWDMDESYRSDAFGRGKAYGSQAFIYYLSDYVFGDLEASDLDDVRDLQVGDIIVQKGTGILVDDSQYMMVTGIADHKISYVTVDKEGYVNWKLSMEDKNLLDKDGKRLDKNVELYTRYPGSGSGSHRGDRLTNGDAITEKNVKYLLEEISHERDYRDGDDWIMGLRYNTEMFGRCEGSEAYAATISDKVFGKLDYDRHTKLDDLKIGDVICINSHDRDKDDQYWVVTDLDGRYVYYTTAYEDRHGDGYISWKEEERLSDLERDYDFDIYTRYPAE